MVSVAIRYRRVRRGGGVGLVKMTRCWTNSAPSQPIYVIITHGTSNLPSNSAVAPSRSPHGMHQTGSASRPFTLAPFEAFGTARGHGNTGTEAGEPQGGNVLTGPTPSRMTERGAAPVNLADARPTLC
jgi:hypothetical protein